jgi:DnaK suppressor protein
MSCTHSARRSYSAGLRNSDRAWKGWEIESFFRHRFESWAQAPELLLRLADSTSRQHNKEIVMFTQVQLSATRQRLRAMLDRLGHERAELVAELSRPHGEADPNIAGHPEEQGGVRLEEEVSFRLLENEDYLTAQINAALGRLDAGSYGACTSCSRPISTRRLQALPYASECYACANRAGTSAV